MVEPEIVETDLKLCFLAPIPQTMFLSWSIN